MATRNATAVSQHKLTTPAVQSTPVRASKGVHTVEMRGPGLHGTCPTDKLRDQVHLVTYILARIQQQSNGCILWTGPKSNHPNHGYGLVIVGKRRSKAGRLYGVQRKVHRVVWELLLGPVPHGLCLDHRCRTRLCVNVAHMDPTTPAENVRRGIPAETRVTHCPRGHEYSPENTSYSKTVRGSKSRNCKTCLRDKQRELRASGYYDKFRDKYLAVQRAGYHARKAARALAASTESST